MFKLSVLIMTLGLTAVGCSDSGENRDAGPNVQEEGPLSPSDGPLQWIRRLGGAGHDGANAVALDPNGHMVVTGYFQESAAFGGERLVSAGYHDIFVAKYNSSGEHVWSHRFGSSGDDRGRAVAIDVEGNIYVAGFFEGTVMFGEVELSSAGACDVFVAAFNSAGQLLWCRRYGGTGEDRARAVAVDSAGNLTVAGEFSNTASFGGSGLVSTGGFDAFVASYDAAGGHLWSSGFGDIDNDWANAVTVDRAGDIIVIGDFMRSVSLGDRTHTSLGGSDVFVAKYDINGESLWSRHLGGIGDDQGADVTVDQAGDIFLIGNFSDSMSFDSLTLLSAGDKDVFVIKLNANGNGLWGQSFGGDRYDSGSAITVNTAGTLTITGLFEEQANLGGHDLVGFGSHDIFIASYDLDGVHLMSHEFGAESWDKGADALSLDEMTVVVGEFWYTVNFAGASFTSEGSTDIFVMRL